MPIPSQRKYDTIHLQNLERYARKLRGNYVEAMTEIINLSVNLSLNTNSAFYFRNYSEVNRKVNEVLKSLYDNVYGGTVSGIQTEWDLAVEKNNELAEYVFGTSLKDLPKRYKQKYFSTNALARRNFVYRKDNGLQLSDKVWKNTRQLKTELELSLELGIGDGKSAESIAREVKRYLNEPDRLYRRIRDKPGGELRLSKAAKAYNPGQGVYRSSYKNSLRLTRNENNFSYEGSQWLKRQQQDFIVGIQIQTTPSHNPADDKGGISCLSLEGRYPKDFDWTYKWHVNCLCYSTNILKTREELDEDVDLILSGKQPTTPSKNQISKTPNTYNSLSKEWLEKSKNWKSQPRTFAKNK